MWEQPRVPVELSHWTFHTLGATGTPPRSSLRTRETVEGTQADSARSRPNLTALYNLLIWPVDPPTGEGPVFTVSMAPFWLKTLRLSSRTPDSFPFIKVSTPCCGPRTEGQPSPWPSTTVPRRRTQSPWKERCRLSAILTPRPQGHSPSCRISLWGGVRVPTGVYIDHPLHPPSWEPIATPFTISGTIGGCICHFLKLKYQWASTSSRSPYMSNTVLWPPASVVLRAGPHNRGWRGKLWVPFYPLITLANPQGLWDLAGSGCGINWPMGNNFSGIKHWSFQYWAQGESRVLEEGLKYKNICQASRKWGQGLQEITDHGEGERETIKLKGWDCRSSLLRMIWRLGPREGACVLNCVLLFVTPWTVTHQALLSVGFHRQEHWSVLPFPSRGCLPNPAIEPMSPMSPALACRFFIAEPPGKLYKGFSDMLNPFPFIAFHFMWNNPFS